MTAAADEGLRRGSRGVMRKPRPKPQIREVYFIQGVQTGLIVYNGRHWGLPMKGDPHNDETPGGDTPSASDDEDLSDLV